MMEFESAVFQSTSDRNKYWFESVGDAIVKKAVVFDEMDLKGRYNLGLADIIDNKLDFDNVSNNKDLKFLFNTIASIIIDYTDMYPEREIYFTSSTNSRTRLYRGIISKNINLIIEQFHIYGQTLPNEHFTTFKKDINYIGFLICRK